MTTEQRKKFVKDTIQRLAASNLDQIKEEKEFE